MKTNETIDSNASKKKDTHLSNETGEYVAYSVQAKLKDADYVTPFTASTGDIITDKWKDICVNVDGIPNDDFKGLAVRNGYYSLENAQTRRYFFLACNHRGSLVTRLRRVKLSYSYEIHHDEYVNEEESTW